MKKIIAILVIIIAAGTSGFAKDNTVDNARVLAGFRQEFGNIANVSWYKTEHSFVAKFALNTSKVTAHFDAEGNLLATSRNISDAQLPTRVINRLMKKFPNQQIHNIMEYVTDDATRYVIMLESETSWTNIKAEAAGGLTVLSKFEKQ